MIKKSILLASILSFLLLGTAFKASTPGQDWKFYFGKNYLTVAVVLNNGVAFVGGEEGVLYALDSKRGTANWQFKAEGAIAQPPLFDNDLLYFCTKSGNVYCLNALNGKLIWVININSKLVCTPILAGDMLCIYSRNEVIGLDKANGLDMWKTQLKVSDNPQMATDDHNIYFADDMKAYSLNSLDGKINWDYDLNTYGVSDVLLAKNKLIFINAGKVFALDKETAKKKWIFELDTKSKVRFQNKPNFLNDLVYVSYANELIALSIDDGEKQWVFKTKLEEELYAPIVRDNSIWLSSRGKTIFNISADKGRKLENYTIDIIQESPVRYENKSIFFTTEDGHAIAYRLI